VLEFLWNIEIEFGIFCKNDLCHNLQLSIRLNSWGNQKIIT
jgi:hypothetical protein